MPKLAKEDDIRYLKKIQNKLQKNKFNQNNKRKLKEITDKIRILENKKTDDQSDTDIYNIELSLNNNDNNKQNKKIPSGHTNFSWNKRDSKVPCGHTNFSW